MRSYEIKRKNRNTMNGWLGLCVGGYSERKSIRISTISNRTNRD